MNNLDKAMAFKLSKFEESIMHSVNQKCKTVQAEVDEYKSQELQKYTDDIVSKNKSRAVSERTEMERLAVKEVSAKRTEYRKRLMNERERYTRVIFDSVERNLVDFSKSDAYLDHLVNAIKKACLELPSGDILVQLKDEDMCYADKLIGLCESEIAVESSKDIRIGGAVIINESVSMKCDYTFDTRLLEQKRNFYFEAGCVIDF